MPTEKFMRDVATAIDDLGLEDVLKIMRGVEGYELARALLMVLARRHGEPLVEEVNAELLARREELRGHPLTHESETAKMLSTSELWNDLIKAEDIAPKPSATS